MSRSIFRDADRTHLIPNWLFYVVTILIVMINALVLVLRQQHHPHLSRTNIQNSAPAISNTEWLAALDHITAVENDLFQHPDPSRVASIMLPSCSCYQADTDSLSQLQQRGLHIAGPNISLSDITLVASTLTEVTVHVAVTLLNQPAVDAAGQVVEQSPKSDHVPWTYTLKEGPDGQWRISSRELLAKP